MKKAYEAHESVYRRMMQEGIPCWDKSMDVKRKAIDPNTKRFLVDVLSQCVTLRASISFLWMLSKLPLLMITTWSPCLESAKTVCKISSTVS